MSYCSDDHEIPTRAGYSIYPLYERILKRKVAAESDTPDVDYWRGYDPDEWGLDKCSICDFMACRPRESGAFNSVVEICLPLHDWYQVIQLKMTEIDLYDVPIIFEEMPWFCELTLEQVKMVLSSPIRWCSKYKLKQLQKIIDILPKEYTFPDVRGIVYNVDRFQGPRSRQQDAVHHFINLDLLQFRAIYHHDESFQRLDLTRFLNFFVWSFGHVAEPREAEIRVANEIIKRNYVPRTPGVEVNAGAVIDDTESVNYNPEEGNYRGENVSMKGIFDVTLYGSRQIVQNFH